MLRWLVEAMDREEYYKAQSQHQRLLGEKWRRGRSLSLSLLPYTTHSFAYPLYLSRDKKSHEDLVADESIYNSPHIRTKYVGMDGMLSRKRRVYTD